MRIFAQEVFSARRKKAGTKGRYKKTFHMSVQMRNCCFTCHNYTDDDIRFLSDIVDFRVNGRQIVDYIVFQKEHGRERTEEWPEGRPHLQGYMEFTTRRTANGLNRISPTFVKMHMRRRARTQAQAIAYCKKTGLGGRDPGTEVYEFGVKRSQGAPGHEGKNQWTKLAEEIRDGKKWDEIKVDYGGEVIQKRAGVLNYIEDFTEHRSGKPKVIIFYSEESGTGKSYLARRTYPNAYYPPWPRGGRWWWPQYHQEETVVLDEFRHQISYDKMLNLVDFGKFWVEAKGSMHKMKATTIVITTNIAPWKWYPKKGRQGGAMLQRRLKEFSIIYKFDDPMPWLEIGEQDEDDDIVQVRTPNPSYHLIQLEEREEVEEENGGYSFLLNAN